MMDKQSMKNLIPYIVGVLIFGGTNPPASAAKRGIPRLDLGELSKLLTNATFDFPDEARRLWQHGDGLPDPNDAQFAGSAARFINKNPVTATHKHGPTLWDADKTASRQLKCLAYLATGKQERRPDVASLCAVQAMRLQWTLPIRTAQRHPPDPAFYAATSSLVLTGSVVRDSAADDSGARHVAAQWLRTGMGQFVTSGSKGRDELRGVAEAVIKASRASSESQEIQCTEQEFFAELDLSQPDMRDVARHVTAGKWRQAKDTYVEMLARRFSWDRGWPDINYQKAVDLVEANDICQNVFVIRAHMHRRYDYGKEVDWAKVIDRDIESRVWMNHHPWTTALVNAWQETGDDKYVKHLCRLFNSWYETSPPTFKRSSAQWRTLEVGGRPGQRWGVVLLALAKHPVFRRECLLNMARSLLDHGKYLSMYAARGGNWLQVESSGLACVALLFPEFKLSPLFYETAMNRLAWVNATAFLPDGFQSEGSPGYHYFPLRGIASAMRLANFLNAPVPQSLRRQYEAGVEVLQYISYPDQTLPMLSDWNPHRSSVTEVLATGAEVFDREDFRWFATAGREGKLPAQASHDFTHAGYCVMRDRWGPQGQMLIFDAGYFGAGHQHEDKLNFVFYAGGRELIGDPGIYSYKHDEFEPYWRGTWSHNTIVVDGLSQHRALGPLEEIPDPDRRFVIGDGFDFAVGWYRRAYSPRNSGLWGGRTANDADAAIRDVQHQRCIFYLKGKYAIICDRLLGEGTHQVDILFHPAPVIMGKGAARKSRAVDLKVRADGVVITKETQHANVAIIPAQGEHLEVLDLIEQKDPVRGWFALYAIEPSHDIVYRCKTELPRHFETVVQPLPPGEAEPLKVQSRQVDCEEGKTCAALKYDGDLFLISYDGPTEMACADVKFVGTALLLKSDKSNRAAKAYMVDAKLFTVGGKQLFSADVQRDAVSLVLR
jgi:hypothetical protein